MRSNERGGSIGLSGSPSFTATLSSRSRWTRWLSRVLGIGHDVFGQHAAPRPDDRGQANGVIALARADVGDRHPGLHAGELHHLLRLAEPVAGVFGREGVADDRRDRRDAPSGNCGSLRRLTAGGQRQQA